MKTEPIKAALLAALSASVLFAVHPTPAFSQEETDSAAGQSAYESSDVRVGKALKKARTLATSGDHKEAVAHLLAEDTWYAVTLADDSLVEEYRELCKEYIDKLASEFIIEATGMAKKGEHKKAVVLLSSLPDEAKASSKTRLKVTARRTPSGIRRGRCCRLGTWILRGITTV